MTDQFKYVPYTYFIYHIPTGYFYYGAKYGKHANPQLFWNKDHKHGYFTCSKLVHKLINEYGVESFDAEVDEIFDNPASTIIYEKDCIRKIIHLPKCLNGNIGGIPDINNNLRKVIINGESSYSKAGKKISAYYKLIDTESGLTNAQIHGIKTSKFLNSVDMETGLTNAKLLSLNYWNSLSEEELAIVKEKMSDRMRGKNNIIHKGVAKEKMIASLNDYYKSDKWHKNKEIIARKIKQSCIENNIYEKHSKWMLENNPTRNTEWYNDGSKNYRLCYNDPLIDDLNLSKGRISFKMERVEHTCDVCGLTGKGPNMKRYHFSNCKQGK